MRTIFYCLIFMATTSLYAQTPALNWAHAYPTSISQTSQAICSDQNQNIYVAGGFDGMVDFDPGPDSSYLSSLAKTPDLFLQKFDSLDDLLWVKHIEAATIADTILVFSSKVDSSNNLYLFGTYSGTIDFDPGPGIFNMSSSVSSGLRKNYFVLKLDEDGIFQWALQTESTRRLSFLDFEVDEAGNSFVGGDFVGTVDFDPGPGVFNQTNTAFGRIFLQKLDADGNFLWANQFAHDGFLDLSTIDVDPQGNLLVSAMFTGILDADPGPASFNFETVNSSGDLVILKLDLSGNFIWAKHIKGIGATIFADIQTDAVGNIYLAGDFRGRYDFDPGLDSTIVDASSNWSLFLEKLTSQGDFLWIKLIEGADSTLANAQLSNTRLSLDSDANLYVTGAFLGDIDFDPGNGTALRTASGMWGVSYIARYNASGDFDWVHSFEADGFDVISQIAVPTPMNIYHAGSFRSPVDVDPGLGSFTLNPQTSLFDFFFAKWGPDNCMGMAVIIDSSMNVSCIGPGFASGYGIGGQAPYSYVWDTNPASTDTFINISDKGIYALTATDANGCSRTSNILIFEPSNPTGQDLRINLTSNSPRPGFPTRVWLDAFNDGCDSVTGEVIFVLNPLLSLINSNPAPDTIRGDTLAWSVNNMSFDSPHFMASLELMVSKQAIIGDLSCVSAAILPSAGESNFQNNQQNFCQPIINSYDPNDKLVLPQGACEAGYTLHDEALSYTIRFQNTGNADAINIFILDTLDLDLDLNSLKVVGQSHESLVTELMGDRTLKFRFDNIHLPDSTTNEAQSHGYVIFEVTPLPNRINGTELKNRAGIYFDFNEPIITNTVLNTLVDVIPTLNETLTQVGGTLVSNEPMLAGISYQWVDCNNGNSLIAGATGQSYSPETNGTYAVMIDNGNCSAISACMTVMNVGIDAEFQSQIKLYPNPTTASLQIDLGAYYPTTSIEIINAKGQILDRRSFGLSDKIRPELPEQKGMYFIKVYAGGKLALLKVLRR